MGSIMGRLGDAGTVGTFELQSFRIVQNYTAEHFAVLGQTVVPHSGLSKGAKM